MCGLRALLSHRGLLQRGQSTPASIVQTDLAIKDVHKTQEINWKLNSALNQIKSALRACCTLLHMRGDFVFGPSVKFSKLASMGNILINLSCGGCESCSNMRFSGNCLSFKDFYNIFWCFCLLEELVVVERWCATQLVPYKNYYKAARENRKLFRGGREWCLIARFLLVKKTSWLSNPCKQRSLI